MTGQLVRKVGAVRCAVASVANGRAPLAWLNEIIDAQANQITYESFYNYNVFIVAPVYLEFCDCSGSHKICSPILK